MYYNIPSRWFLSKSFVQMNLLPRSSLSFPYSCIAVSSSGMSTYWFSSCHLWHTLRPQVSFVSMHLRDSCPRILTWTPLLSNVSPHSRRCRAARVNSMGGDNHEGVRTLLGTFHGPEHHVVASSDPSAPLDAKNTSSGTRRRLCSRLYQNSFHVRGECITLCTRKLHLHYTIRHSKFSLCIVPPYSCSSPSKFSFPSFAYPDVSMSQGLSTVHCSRVDYLTSDPG